jgi:predicted N-acetyltransferase YhbS
MAGIDFYDAARDEAGALECWELALGRQWPINRTLLRIMTHAEGPCVAGDHLVAHEEGRVAGFALTHLHPVPAESSPRSASLSALVVAPWAQRTGIAKALLEAVLDTLFASGVRRVQLGGGLPRLWPGVPNDLPAAVDFFRVQGWGYTHTTCDLTRSLTDYETPPDLWAHMDAQGISIRTATESDMPEVLAFERREFPGWYEEYAYPARVGDHRDVIVARDGNGVIVGALMLYTPHSHPSRGDALWRTLLGEELGGLNAVGVAEAERGRGIGLALVARGSEVLKARGMQQALIGWTTLTDFYGKLGYAPWRDYEMSARDI